MDAWNENKKLIANGSNQYTLTECYDKVKVEYLLNNKDIIKKYCDEDWYFNSLVYQLKQLRNGEKVMVYSMSKDEETSPYYSRWNAKGSAQGFPREIRKFLQGNKNVRDIDIVNSAPSIILNITNKYNIPNKYLNRYVENRDKIINEYYDGDKEKIKDFIKFCLFANDAKHNNKFEEKMVEEMKKIRIELSKHENFKPIYEYKIKNKSPNPYGSFMMDVYSIYETNIIWKAMEFCKGKFIIIVQQYDGFQILIDTNKGYSLCALIELKEHLKNETGFNIEFTYKSNESEIKMDVEEETKDDKTDDETDEEEEEEEKETVNYSITLDELETPIKLAKTIKDELNKNLVYCCEKWFMKHGHLWILVKEPSSMVIETINIFIDHTMNKISNDIITEPNETKKEELRKNLEKYRKQQKSIDSSSYYSQLLKHLKTKLLDNSFIHKLDNYPYMLCFKNGVFNMKTNKFTKNFKQCPNITKTIDYDYEKAKDEDKKQVLEIIKKICNCNDKHLAYYLSVLGYSLTGDASKEQSIFFCIGNKGANGKTLIFNALSEHVLKGFVNKIDRKAFQEGYEKKHKHLMDFRTNRILFIEELAKKKSLDIETLKEVADGNTISNEVMFGTKEDINIMAKLFCLGNHTPNIEDDGGTSRRVRQLEFTSEFKDGVEDDYEKRIFKKDKSMGDKLGGEYKLALLNLLLDYAHDYYEEKELKEEPEEFIQAKNETMEVNNVFKTWFNDNCEVGEGYKVGKDELMKATKLSFKELKDEMKRLDFKYNKDKMLNKKRGIWEGFRIKKEEVTGECEIDSEEEEE